MYTFQNKEEELFLKAVSLCHTVQISYDQTDGPGDPFSHANGFSPQMEYYASSPDEKALVEATKRSAQFLCPLLLCISAVSCAKYNLLTMTVETFDYTFSDCRMGVTFIGSHGENMEIKTFGKAEKYITLFCLF